jgi:large subunit ribosomal protein L23
MADLKYYDIIDKPLMTEKSMRLTEESKYTFYVHPQATKTQIKEAVEKMFEGVKVAKVNTMLSTPKRRQRRGFAPGKTVRKKKAIVSLTPGSREIELFPGL